MLEPVDNVAGTLSTRDELLCPKKQVRRITGGFTEFVLAISCAMKPATFEHDRKCNKIANNLKIDGNVLGSVDMKREIWVWDLQLGY